jgi:hypothetical protein
VHATTASASRPDKPAVSLPYRKDFPEIGGVAAVILHDLIVVHGQQTMMVPPYFLNLRKIAEDAFKIYPAFFPLVRPVIQRSFKTSSVQTKLLVSLPAQALILMNHSQHESLSVELDGVVPKDLALGFIRNRLGIELR